MTWTIDAVDYRATLTTAGATGNAVVTYRNPQDGQSRSVRQDLVLTQVQGRTVYVGSGPVDATSGTSAICATGTRSFSGP